MSSRFPPFLLCATQERKSDAFPNQPTSESLLVQYEKPKGRLHRLFSPFPAPPVPEDKFAEIEVSATEGRTACED
jgi:hypothetical protein